MKDESEETLEKLSRAVDKASELECPKNEDVAQGENAPTEQ
jgi:hypothetical protein